MTRMVARTVCRQVPYEVCRLVPQTQCDPCAAGSYVSGGLETQAVPYEVGRPEPMIIEQAPVIEQAVPAAPVLAPEPVRTGPPGRQGDATPVRPIGRPRGSLPILAIEPAR